MSVVLTKIKIPQRRKDILRRQRLVDLLHDNIYRKLIFVSAPAGYGKTTLLTDFANDIDAKVCWYRIDRDDIDIVPFALHLISSFQQNYPEFGQETARTIETGGGAPDPIGLGIELVNEMVRQVNDFTILILDDFHWIGEKQPIVDFIETLLEYLPDQVRCVIASRSVYGIPAANLYVRSDLATLGADNLRFRPQELKALVQEHYDIQLSDQQVEEIAKRSDGWIIAILLAIRALEQGIEPRFEQTSGEMYDFLAQEVVALQPEHLRKFLLKTSILDEFNVTICNTILEISDSASLIQELEERNLFLTRIDTDRGDTNFRYHQLFSDFLAQRFEESDPGLKIELHRRAADWYRQNFEWEKAVQHKISAGDREDAAQWIEKIASDLFVAGRTSVISEWVHDLSEPVDVRSKAPWLSLNWAKVLYERGDYSAGDQFLEIAEKELQKGVNIDQLLNLYVTKGISRIYQGQPQQAIDLAEQALELIEENDQDNYYRYQAERLLGIAYRHQGRTRESVKSLELAAKGFREIVETPDTDKNQAIHDLAETLNDLGIAHFDNGNILDAQRYLEEVLSIRRRQRSNLGALVIALNNVGYMYYLLGRYREAWGAYEEAYTIASSIRHHRGIVHILNSRGDLLRDLEDWKAAETSYLEAKRRADSSDHYALFSTYIGLSELERRRRNYHDALYWLREAARIRNQSVESPDYQVGLGQVYLDMGQLEMARQAFNQAITKWEDSEHPNQNQALAYFLAGRVCYELNDPKSSIEYVKRAFSASARLGYDQFIVVAARPSKKYLQFINSKQYNLPQAKNISQRVEDFPNFQSLIQEPAERVEVPGFKLVIQGFGSGAVLKDGEYITVSDWRSTNARALFFFIMDRQGVRKEDIALDLWPDFTQSQATSNFHSTLWRVRKALGSKDAVIFDQNRYVLHPSIEFEYDVRQFEELLSSAFSQDLAAEEKMDLLVRAEDLYSGDFLLDIQGDWADQRRNELIELHQRALEELGFLYFQSAQYLDAKSIFEQLLRVDPYRDDIHLAVMRCLAKSGTPTGAKAHFANYKEFLWKELRAAPQPELQNFCDSLP
jgi:LuxR family maltose regulon positive regulatory protein